MERRLASIVPSRHNSDPAAMAHQQGAQDWRCDPLLNLATVQPPKNFLTNLTEKELRALLWAIVERGQTTLVLSEDAPASPGLPGPAMNEYPAGDRLTQSALANHAQADGTQHPSTFDNERASAAMTPESVRSQEEILCALADLAEDPDFVYSEADGKPTVLNDKYYVTSFVIKGARGRVYPSILAVESAKLKWRFSTFTSRSRKTYPVVAIKYLHEARDPFHRGTVLSNVQREIAILKRLRNKHIVPIIEILSYQRDRYLVMPYIGRGPVLQRTSDQQSLAYTPLDPVFAPFCFRQVFCAVEYLHRREIVHNDIKPENILMGNNYTVFLADFSETTVMDPLKAGLENLKPKPIDGELRDANSEADPPTLRETTAETSAASTVPSLLGTLMFLAPECRGTNTVEGKPKDIWALGITLFLALFGQFPLPTGQLQKEGAKAEAEYFNLFEPHLSQTPSLVDVFLATNPQFCQATLHPSLMAGIDLLREMLRFKPKERITIQAARDHRFFLGLSTPNPDANDDSLRDDTPFLGNLDEAATYIETQAPQQRDPAYDSDLGLNQPLPMGYTDTIFAILHE